MPNVDFSKMITCEQRQAEDLARKQAEFSAAIQMLVDDTARSRNYGDGNALASYVASNVPVWVAEAQAFVAWRDAVWVYANTELAKVQAGQRAIPASDAFLAELPVIEWPVATTA